MSLIIDLFKLFFPLFLKYIVVAGGSLFAISYFISEYFTRSVSFYMLGAGAGLWFLGMIKNTTLLNYKKYREDGAIILASPRFNRILILFGGIIFIVALLTLGAFTNGIKSSQFGLLNFIGNLIMLPLMGYGLKFCIFSLVFSMKSKIIIHDNYIELPDALSSNITILKKEDIKELTYVNTMGMNGDSYQLITFRVNEEDSITYDPSEINVPYDIFYMSLVEKGYSVKLKQ